ncbi:MAG: nucleoside triphosphate pyrophosphohydrolase [Leptolyngbya sp. SIO3F4]|nr:nucleoside triphosphate pyrophosphohydrolase [Leptolyngbya sp. SIO3F4]
MEDMCDNTMMDEINNSRRFVNKLVRDRIPEIILEHDEIPVTKKVQGQELQEHLLNKLNEEYNELLENLSIEEVVDMIEVLLGIARILGHNESETLQSLYEKRNKNGGFDHGIFLIEVAQPK